MPRVHLLMPLGDFIPYIADILAGCGGTVYLQKKSAYGAAKTGSSNCRNLTDLRQSLKFLSRRNRRKSLNCPQRYFTTICIEASRRHGRAGDARSYRYDRATAPRKKSGRGYLGKFSPEINSKTTKRSVAGLAAALLFTKIIFTRSAAWTVKF